MTMSNKPSGVFFCLSDSTLLSSDDAYSFFKSKGNMVEYYSILTFLPYCVPLHTD